MISNEQTDHLQNRILNALPPEEFARLRPHLRAVNLSSGQILYHQGSRITDVFFPQSGIVSLVTLLQDGAGVEVGVVGRNGMVGATIVLGDDISPNQAIVQIPDGAYQLPAEILRQEIKACETLPILLNRLVALSLKESNQTAACNRNHRINERLAYWLLTCHDGVEGDRLLLTQDFVAQMLGVRRAGVGEAAMTLQSLGLIKYSRGEITILDREGLEEFGCECYREVRSEFLRLLGPLFE